MTRPTYLTLKVLMIATALTLAAYGLSLMATQKPAGAAFPGENGRIAFAGAGDSFAENPELNLEIFTIRPDGTDRRMLASTTRKSIVSGEPAWSPSGARIAFFSNRGINTHGRDFDIFTMTARGTGVTRLTDNSANETQPAWSPDGSKIVFVRSKERGSDIYVMNADGTNDTRLTNDTGFNTQPAWSPDGSQIAFTRAESISDFSSVYVMNADGTNPQDIGSGLPFSGSPAWSPNGSKIAFVSICPTVNSGVCIYKMNPDGTGKRPLTTHEPQPDPLNDDEPAWSPNGSKIAFSRVGSGLGGWEVFKMDADGSAQIRLTHNSEAPWGSGNAPEPDWGPRPATSG